MQQQVSHGDNAYNFSSTRHAKMADAVIPHHAVAPYLGKTPRISVAFNLDPILPK